MRPVLAHGFGQGYELPLPLWLYLYGAAAAVALSFLPLALLSGKGRGADVHDYPRFDLLRVPWLRSLLNARVFLAGLRLFSAALFGVVLVAGFVGDQGGRNVAPTFVWAIWWVGFATFAAFVGNLWPLVNPWKVAFVWADGIVRRLGREGGLRLGIPYPEALGVWPAAALYLAFVWFENVFPDPATPRNIALFALLYSLVTLYGMALFGKETWLRRGEAFSVFFGLLGRFAPTEVRVKGGRCVNCCACFGRAAPEDRELNLRPFAVGLGPQERVPPGGVAFVLLVLSSVTYDGLLETPLWVEVVRLTPVTQTTGLALSWALFLGVYLGFMKLGEVLSKPGAGYGRAVAAYAYALVPIAVAYQLAHYHAFLLIQGQVFFARVSDPFGWGWDLFGTIGFRPWYGVVGAGGVWYTQVALIVAGHVVAVYLAHGASRSLGGRSLRGQMPMLVLMVLYTVSSLWILAQPVVG